MSSQLEQAIEALTFAEKNNGGTAELISAGKVFLEGMQKTLAEQLGSESGVLESVTGAVDMFDTVIGQVAALGTEIESLKERLSGLAIQ